MSRKERAARLRKLNAEMRKAEEERLAKEFARLSTMTLGLSSQPKLKPSKKALSPKPFIRETPKIESLPTGIIAQVKVRTVKRQIPLDEYERREKVAQEEIARKKKRVAVLVNKSAYQYITEETDLTTLGRK